MKLFKLRDWLTVEEGARHLTSVLEEKVGAADILRLALDGQLILSVNFVNKAKARLGRVVPFKDVPMAEMPHPARLSEVLWYPQGLCIETVQEPTDDTRFLCFDEEVVSIRGVWDLAMIGGERVDVEHKFHSMTGGPPVELVSFDGSFVYRPTGDWAQLQSSFLDKVIDAPNGKTRVHGGYYPAGGLPQDALLIVRTRALADFQASLMAPQSVSGGGDSLGTRERETLLKLVIGMAIGGYGYEPDAPRSKTPGEIVSDLAKCGISVTDDTVRKYLKEAATTVLPMKPTPNS